MAQPPLLWPGGAIPARNILLVLGANSFDSVREISVFQSHSELDLPFGHGCRRNEAECRRRTQRRGRWIEVRVIQKIEKLDADFESGVVADRMRLFEGEVNVVDAGPAQCVAADSAKGTWRRH